MTALHLRRKPQAVEVRSHAWAQKVDAPAAWAEEHRWLLEAAFAVFGETGVWPSIEWVQRNVAGEPERAVAVEQLMIGIRARRPAHAHHRG